jgi:FkbM family methyltransferase
VNPSLDDYRSGRRFILCDLICEENLLTTPIVVIDVGAHDALADPRWTKISRNNIRVHGFEPDVKECARLNEAASAAGFDFHFHPVALAEQTGPAEFYRYAEPAANSFFAPNEPLIRRWCYTRSLHLLSQFKVLEKARIEAVSLNDWAQAESVTDFDFVKLNVQGAELDVLRGAGRTLESAMGMVVEQTFNPTYINAPLFGKVYNFIEQAGFCMFDVVGMNRVARVRSPIHITEDKIFVVSGLWPHHQFFEGHFFYLRDPLCVGDEWNEGRGPSIEKCFKLACLAEVFGQIEYAFEVLDWIAAAPSATRVASATRKIIDEGARLYRAASTRALTPNDTTLNDLSLMRTTGPSATELALILDGKEAQIAALREEIRASQVENAHLTAVLEQIYQSRSWKVAGVLARALGHIRR